jgi:hypothetical protein
MDIVVAELKYIPKGHLDGSPRVSHEKGRLLEELIRGIEMTGLRASHRALTVRALVAKRKGKADNAELTLNFLAEASSIRERALVIVRAQETMYRYPLNLIARKRTGFTSYDFGYLYPVSNLFFWYREEQQVKNDRFDGLFMNIWDFRKILSIKSLLW